MHIVYYWVPGLVKSLNGAVEGASDFFSSLTFCITSLIHWLCDRAVAYFHLNRIERLANGEEKAMTFCE